LIAANQDNVEEVDLARTLLAQGHLATAQRLLLKVCQEQPELAPAFRVLGEVLQHRGDGRRARALLEYADELDAGRTVGLQKSAEISAPLGESASEAVTRQVTPPSVLREAADNPGSPSPVPAGAVLTLPVPAGIPTFSPGQQPRPGTSAPAQPDRVRRRWLLPLALLALILVVGAGGAAYLGYGRSHLPKTSLRDALDRALASGALAGLLHARELARISLESRTPDPAVLVRLALVNAFLTCDYAVDAGRDAEEALQRALALPGPSSERASLAATAHALLALAAGDRALARSQADLALSVSGPAPLPFALLVSARVHILAGDPDGAAQELDHALQLGPRLLPVVVDWAAARIDAGDAVSAAQALVPLLGESPDNSRARLVLADAERALGEQEWARRLDPACAGDSKISRSVRTLCAIQSAVRARLDGDRAGAVRKCKAIAQATDDSIALSKLSLLLALLGEIDAADDLLQKAAKLAEPSSVSLQWARLAISLGRAQNPEPSPLLDHAAGTERDLVAMRAAYARAGKAGLASALKAVPPGVLDIDWDVRALAMLGRASAPAKPELAALEKRGERGNPVAAYVLGTLALADGDFKVAARRLAHGLLFHGDACRDAALYLESFAHLGRGAVLDKVGLRALRSRNAQCPLPEL